MKKLIDNLYGNIEGKMEELILKKIEEELL